MLQFSTTVIGAIAYLAGTAFAQTGAKAAFYAESGATVPATTGQPRAGPPAPQAARAQPDYMGLKYWVELTSKDGQQKQVTTDHVFRSGDRIALHVQSNRGGHLYMTSLGSTGRYTLLFPMGGRSHVIQANVEYRIPPTSAIRFDDNPGEEKLLVVLSPVDVVPATTVGTALSTEEIARLVAASPVKGAKDLVLEVDSADLHPASYAAAPVTSLRDGRIIVPVRLTHE